MRRRFYKCGPIESSLFSDINACFFILHLRTTCTYPIGCCQSRFRLFGFNSIIVQETH